MPQGSVLGPRLLSTYVDEFSEATVILDAGLREASTRNGFLADELLFIIFYPFSS